LRGFDYLVDECPMAAGNRHISYKEALNDIEVRSPGAKHSFYFGFLERASSLFTPEAEDDRSQLQGCAVCGSPTTAEICAFCRLVDRAGGHQPESVPVHLGSTRRESSA
jgi:tRNA(Ile)-lysidine synthase TilS/MesJ